MDTQTFFKLLPSQGELVEDCLPKENDQMLLQEWNTLMARWSAGLHILLNKNKEAVGWDKFKEKCLMPWDAIDEFYKNLYALQCLAEEYMPLYQKISNERIALYEDLLKKRKWSVLMRSINKQVLHLEQKKILEDWTPGSPALQKKADYLNQKVLHFQNKFSKNVKKSFENKYLCLPAMHLRGWGQKLPLRMRQTAKKIATQNGKKGEYWFDLTDFSYAYIIKFCPNRDIRKKMYYLKHTLASTHQDAGYFDNTKVMRNIILYRNKEAKAYGFRSSVQMSLQGNVLNEEQRLECFLSTLGKMVREKAIDELKDLRAMHLIENASIGSVKAWDYAYLEQRMSSSFFENKDCSTSALNISKIVMLRILKKVVHWMSHQFNLTLKEHKGGVSAFNMHFSFYRGHGSKKSHVGDLCIVPFVKHQQITDSMPFNVDIRGGIFGEKFGAKSIVCFQWEHQREDFLHADLVHVFHELGHAFQNILMRTKYRSQGIETVPRDAIEVFSQFFERFAWEKKVLQEIGARVWAKNMETLKASQNTNKYLQLLNEVVQYLTEIKVHKNRALGQHMNSIQAMYKKVRKELFMDDYHSAYAMNQLRSFAGTNSLMEHSYLVSEAMAWELWSVYKQWESVGCAKEYFDKIEQTFFKSPGYNFWKNYQNITGQSELNPQSILASRESY